MTRQVMARLIYLTYIYMPVLIMCIYLEYNVYYLVSRCNHLSLIVVKTCCSLTNLIHSIYVGQNLCYSIHNVLYRFRFSLDRYLETLFSKDTLELVKHYNMIITWCLFLTKFYTNISFKSIYK